VVLITGLIILLVISVIAVSSMHNIVLEEKMAGNLRDRNVAFQAAEAGIQVAFSYLEGETVAPLPDDVGTNKVWTGCKVSDASCTAAPADETWLEDNGVEYGTSAVMGESILNDVVSRQPYVAIEDRFAPPLDFEAAAKGSGIHFYTASAVGYGVKASTRVMLQSTIAKVYVW
jgi:type IV pilus assembly protein PilX